MITNSNAISALATTGGGGGGSGFRLITTMQASDGSGGDEIRIFSLVGTQLEAFTVAGIARTPGSGWFASCVWVEAISKFAYLKADHEIWTCDRDGSDQAKRG